MWFFFFNATATTEIYTDGHTLSLHDALPIFDTHVGVDADLGALGLHLGQAPVDVALLHLELGDAVAQEATDAVGPLEHDDVVPGSRELLGGGQAGGSGADDGDALAGRDRRQHGGDPALLPGVVDDLDLDLLDGDRVLVDAEDTCTLAGGRAQPTEIGRAHV